MMIVIQIINIIFRLYSYLILMRILLSWISIDSNKPIIQFIYMITEPILKPFRIILPFGDMGVDLSPLIVFFLIGLFQRLIINIFIRIFF
jgi:YggT family protein